MTTWGQVDSGRLPRGGKGGAAPPGRLASLVAPQDRLLKPDDGPDLAELAATLHDALLQHLDLEKLHATPAGEARPKVEEALRRLLPEHAPAQHGAGREHLVRMVLDEVLGLGPIQALLDDPAVQAIMVNGPTQVYVESDGVIRRADSMFRDDAHIRRVAERILAQVGRRVDESSPMVDARLADGSRVNITLPPATPRHPSLTIRKFRQDRLDMEDLVEAGSLDQRMAAFIGACTAYKRNILISGGTGTGKTTLLNAISAFIPRDERIVSIEDPLELQLQQPHVISMEARPPDMTGGNAIAQRDLLRNSLRMRPDRIIVGEIRGPEAFEMLQAMNTGHEGSLSTVHANTPRDALARVENMVLMAGFELPVRAIREQIASALHLLVQLQRFPDGVRRIVKISEITGMEGEQVTMHDLYGFQRSGREPDGRVSGAFRPTGIRPTFSDELQIDGRPLEPDLFLPSVQP